MAPKSSGRPSARSSATRNQASSPTKQSSDRRSQSPVGRRTRSTRSHSADLGSSDFDLATRKGVRKSKRQASVESAGSEDSSASGASQSNNKRSGKARAAKGSPDLSMVIEDGENEQDEDDEGDEDEEPASIEQDRDHGPLIQSPGGVSQASQMSGTTAITSASAITSHSMDEIGNLDPLIAEYLPDLLASSCRILDRLAPTDASREVVEYIVRDLKVLGSRQGKLLKHDEEKFRIDREHYGSDDYINPTFVQRRLFGNQDLDIDNFRPDPVLHAANLATLVKNLLVTPKESRSTPLLLQTVDTYFPEVFIRGFDNTVQFGNSLLQDETFELGLEIRTQYAITALFANKESEDWDPEQILLSLFLYQPHIGQFSPSISNFEHVLENGSVIDIMRAGPANSEEQNARIISRVIDIREAFQQFEEAGESGDLVDFERLDEMFPWTGFLTRLVQWCRSRLIEIISGINQQGGIDHIVSSLIEAVKANNDQIELDYDPPTIAAPHQPPPAVTITASNVGQNFYSWQGVQELEKLKQRISSRDVLPARPAQQSAPTGTPFLSPANQPGPSRTGIPKPSKISEGVHQRGYDNIQPIIDDAETTFRSTQEYVASWEKHNLDKNKENRPLPAGHQSNPGKRSLLDRQKDTDRSGHDQEYISPSSSHKRPRRERSEESQDSGFQKDNRLPDPERRSAAPVARLRSPIESPPSPPEMVRRQPSDEGVPRLVRQNRRRVEAALPVSARRAADGEYREVTGEEEDHASQIRAPTFREVNAREVTGEEEDHASQIRAPTFREVNAHAKYAVARITQKSRTTQKRIPWSEADTDKFIKLIGEHGCSWADLHRRGEFGHRDQVALKDKARNLKVAFLKAGIALPDNFDKIALSKKEIAAVRAVIPGWEE